MNDHLTKKLQGEFTRRRPTIRFGRRLGQGSFSAAFEAWDGHVPCAVKFSLEPWLNDPGAARERSSLLKTMLDCNGHPHIASFWYIDDDLCGHLATVWELGEMSLDERLQQCLATDGGSESAASRASTAPAKLAGIPTEELWPYMTQAAEGLDFMHAKGIVHRDIKPDNLLLVRGQVKLIDFGFARFADMRSAKNTARGTPAFAPPEATEERLLLEPQYDIYSLAATFIRLATGEFPFGLDRELRSRKLRGEFSRAGLTAQQIDALAVALAPDPRGRRFSSATAFVEALKVAPPPIVGREGGAGRGARSGAGATGAPNAAMKPTFRDRIQQLELIERAEIDRAAREARESRDQRLHEFDKLLHRQLQDGQLPLAYGTVLALLRDDGENSEYRETRKWLEQPDVRTGRPRCHDAAGMSYTLIPSGQFLMGSAESPEELARAFPNANRGIFEREWPRHSVRLTQPFYLSLFPTTLGQFRQFVNATQFQTEGERDGKGGWGLTSEGKWEQKPEFTWRNPGFVQADDHPVVLVSWNDVQEFLKWHCELTKLKSELPSEAQWEYACRAGTTTRHYGGDDLEGLARIGNVCDASAKKAWNASGAIQANDGFAYTSPVGKFQPNAFGVYDMLGNCWEWCQDWLDAKYYSTSPDTDPTGPPSGTYKVLRGGSWVADVWYSRSGCRYGYDPSHRGGFIGFRLLLRVS